MRPTIELRSAAAMDAATLGGLAYGEVADRSGPNCAGRFFLTGAASIACLALGVVGRLGRGHPGGPAGEVPLACACLAALALTLLIADAYRDVDRSSLVPRVLSVVPFLLGVGRFVRCGSWWAAAGAAGFAATAIAVLVANSGDGWTGFFGVRCT